MSGTFVAFYDAQGRRKRKTVNGATTLYVTDADGVASQAVAAGAKLLRPVKDQFYGDRSGTVEDPFGHVWHVATHKEDIPLEELKKRAAAMAAAAGKA